MRKKNVGQKRGLKTTLSASSFAIVDGYVQGMMAEPPQLFSQYLEDGVVASSEKRPLVGGQCISVSKIVKGAARGMKLVRHATSKSKMHGFTVFNGPSEGVQTKRSPAPTYHPGMAINFVKFGSGVQLSVACSPGVLALADKSSYELRLYWSFRKRMLVASPVGSQRPLKVHLLAVSASSTVVEESAGFAKWVSHRPAAFIRI